ncbi:MAG: hypothetical protein COT26_00480 [Candidatus Kerfeldbacteria bacterium CG08_land_8_20_14_0_20_43_14]|uniref:Uncharacterized protein n=1 Tax=Candidatus Kerfeldbacteria bacterium CG08_land_8_20_14_0_20_43_14 TaxID=2014246 RepID=A0A2H0YRN3_9BACT|nr:MAG: hypothetical protein COT26_00480 [Candidatus Kerfeldbacteria bacterium CG08_land_8_20_14_0_20_43_14]
MKIKLKIPHFHLQLIKLSNIIAISLIVFSVISLVYIALSSYNSWYQPLISNSVPEEKLQQKQEKLKLNELQDINLKLDNKKGLADKVTIINPFQ